MTNATQWRTRIKQKYIVLSNPPFFICRRDSIMCQVMQAIQDGIYERILHFWLTVRLMHILLFEQTSLVQKGLFSFKIFHAEEHMAHASEKYTNCLQLVMLLFLKAIMLDETKNVEFILHCMRMMWIRIKIKWLNFNARMCLI